MAESPVDGIPVRTQLAIYGSGTFSNSMGNLAGVLVPLWVVTFGVSGLLVGLVFGARHILPLVLSIHGGALMDRLGTRRVMLVFAVINASVPLLFPLLPNVWMAIGLQAIAGLATSMGWIGAQTLIGQVMKGDTTHAGRLTLSLRFGHLVGPPLIGMAWDLAGPWGAFGVMSLWGWLGFFAALMLPKLDALDGEPRPRVTVRDLLPRWSDYVAAFRMLAVSAILFVAMITMLRNAGNTIQHSFYVVYLNDVIGLSGTAIGFLTSFAAVIGGAGALSVGALARRFTPHWLLLVTVIGAVALIAVTPLLGSFVLLAVAMGLRGASLGISQPLMMSILSRAADKNSQGTSVGLRNTANRLTGVVVPISMGALVDFVGIENGFYLMGGLIITLLFFTGWWARGHPEIAAAS
jgi:MFS family permease